MKLDSIISTRVLLENQATEYVDKVARLLKSTPEDVVKLNKTKREKIALVLTGLYVLGNPNFRKTLGISDQQYQKIVNQLYSNGAAANYVINAGKRMPSQLQTIKSKIDRFDKLSDADKQGFIATLKKIHDSISSPGDSTTKG